ncbi:MAG: integrase/recombinase XerD [Planctomycetaceae bacterium]|jgi:integrase/recombinase XerD
MQSNNPLIIAVWETAIRGFRSWLELDLGLRANSVDAYVRDVTRLQFFAANKAEEPFTPANIQAKHVEGFLVQLFDEGLSPSSQSRILSGLRNFSRYLQVEKIISGDPLELIDAPRPERKLPDVLSIEEVGLIIDAIDLYSKEGIRNRAILETMYSCGLRVSEVVTLRISLIDEVEGMVRVLGKGNKERLIPIGQTTLDTIVRYIEEYRNFLEIEAGCEDTLFLGRRGRELTRQIVSTIFRRAAIESGIRKSVSSRTFRHSLATHLMESGADISLVQEMLGHASITTTEVYTHIDQRYLRDQIMRFHPREQS